MNRTIRRVVPILGLAVALRAPLARAQADAGLPAEMRSAIDAAAREVLAATGAPSASVAVLRDGKIAYVQAYGDAKVDPRAPAGSPMRYSIGSVSKQFTATAILMLAEEGKLSLDDPVSRFLPDLTRANEVTIRQLLSHTSGYQDYWPQDYVPPFMLQEITAAAILDKWAKKPLDFEPGTQYQYSNTGYVAAGVIVEKASGMGLLEFLGSRVFSPLGMASVADIDRQTLGPNDPVGYIRYALGPLRVGPKEGKGWLFAAGELAMTAEDLARWDVGMLDQKLLKPASYRQMQTEVLLKNGLGIHYGLGIDVTRWDGRRVLEHGGEVSGFTAENVVFPDDRAAIVVLVNQDSIGASAAIAQKVAAILFAKGGAGPAEARARQILEGLQKGKVDRTIFTSNGNSYFTDQAIQDFSSSLAPLGAVKQIKQTRSNDRGGMTFRLFEAKYSGKSLSIWERDMPDGRIEQFQVMPGE
jgi:CubicO group peptidase (beta-lactamase class C family)